jgi:hypothetical protein
MRRSLVVLAITTALFSGFSGCGSSNNNGGSTFDGGSGGDGTIGDGSGGDDGSSGDSGGSSGSATGGFGMNEAGGSSSGGTVTCPTGLQCNVQCSGGDGGATTSISGKVYDPAMKNPLYNVAVYVPATPLKPLPRGVPTGADKCNCGALFQSGAIQGTTTGPDGSFKLTNVPTGTAVPLVLQVGKWRRVVHIPVTACQDNPQADKSLALPGTVAVDAGATDDNMPDIAVSTGEADTLECLMLRMGVPPSEYVAGSSLAGHVHVFSGGQPGTTYPGKEPVGYPEVNPMPGAPESDTTLWDSQAHMMPYDITLLSCEGMETYNANPSVLEQYLNAGGRVFASHFHYSWFWGTPISKSFMPSTQSYSPPADWGNLASWQTDITSPASPVGGSIVQTLNGSTAAFPKGQALFQWLGVVGALGQNGVAPTDVPIFQPRYNALVNPTNKPSQPWITSDVPADAGAEAGVPNQTMYFSFDTPVNAPAAPDGGPPAYCGRTVFSDLHVAGSPSTKDTSPPPGGCQNVDLSPQEKVLEFMLFDLSSCVISDSIAPPNTVQ